MNYAIDLKYDKTEKKKENVNYELEMHVLKFSVLGRIQYAYEKKKKKKNAYQTTLSQTFWLICAFVLHNCLI